MRDIEWFDENGDTMRQEDWRLLGRPAAVRAPRDAPGRRARELCLLLANNTGEPHSFQLPQPVFNWTLRLNTADPQAADQPVQVPQVAVAAHSVQLLTAAVEAPTVATMVHAAGDSAMQPEKAPRPTPPAATT